METANPRYYRSKLQGRSKPEKVQILADAILKLVAESTFNRMGKGKVCETLGYNKSMFFISRTYPARGLAKLEKDGLIQSSEGYLSATEKGLEVYHQKLIDTPRAFYPVHSNGTTSRVMPELRKCIAVRYPHLEQVIAMSSVNVGLDEVTMEVTPTPEIAKLDKTFIAVSIEKCIHSVYGKNVKLTVSFARPEPKPEVVSEGASEKPKRTLMEMFTEALIATFGEEGIKNLNGLTLENDLFNFNIYAKRTEERFQQEDTEPAL